MKPDHIAILALRLMVVYFGLGAFFQNAAALAGMIAESGSPKNAWVAEFSIVLISTLGLLALVWTRAPWIARKISTDSDASTAVTLSFSPDELEAFCFSMLGLWFAVDGLIGLAQYLLNSLRGGFYGAVVNVHLALPVVRLAVGIFLVLRAKGMVAALRKLRS